MKNKRRVATADQPDLTQGLAGLDGLNITAKAGVPAKVKAVEQPEPAAKRAGQRGRLELRREKAGRGGKTVSTVTGPAWTQTPARERERLLAEIKRRCACGGKADHSGFEVQGDQREAIEQILSAAGYQVVRAGG